MTRYLVDTDWIIDVHHNRQDSTATLAPQGLAMSAITYGGLYEGAYYARDPVAALDGLRQVVAGKDVLPVTSPIAEWFAIVRGGLTPHLRRQIGDMDLLIAATALHHGLTPVTRNVKDFRPVPGLTLYEPP